MNDFQKGGVAVAADQGTSDGNQTSGNIALGFGSIIVLAFVFAYESVEAWAANLERRHRRGQLLAAYKGRRDWKKGDIPHLRSLRVNRAAERRMERLDSRGRPTVKPFRALDEDIVDKMAALNPLLDAAASPTQRQQALKQWPWWPHYVEALYRGEYAIAKEHGIRAASSETEISVGRALGMSPSAVHAISGNIRRMRKEDPESANFPSMTLAEYNSCLEYPEGWLQARLRD